jgi:hypothetical protein
LALIPFNSFFKVEAESSKDGENGETSGKIEENGKKGRKFVFVGKRMNWDNARAECQRRGGDLATHITKEELDFLTSKVLNRPQTGAAWVGGRVKAGTKIPAGYLRYKDFFTWLNGDPIPKNDGRWFKRRYSYSHMKCMYIAQYFGNKGYTRIDGSRAAAFRNEDCRKKLPPLCKI